MNQMDLAGAQQGPVTPVTSARYVLPHPGGGVEATSKHSNIQTDPRRSNAMPRRHNVIGVATIICPVHLIV